MGTEKVWALFSGGKDSLTMAHHLETQDKLNGCVFFDTKIKTPDIRPHVENVCKKNGWDLTVYETPGSYDDFVMRWGFPRPSGHQWIMRLLKGRCVRLFKKEHPGEVLASGVRRLESKRRMRSVKGYENTWEGVKVVCPIWDWSTDKVWAYVKKHGLTLAPAYKTLHLSGDCLCGSYAHPNELHLISMFYPDVFQRIVDLERRAKEVGVGFNKWGGVSTQSVIEQTDIERFACSACSLERWIERD